MEINNNNTYEWLSHKTWSLILSSNVRNCRTIQDPLFSDKELHPQPPSRTCNSSSHSFCLPSPAATPPLVPCNPNPKNSFNSLTKVVFVTNSKAAKKKKKTVTSELFGYEVHFFLIWVLR